MLGLGLYFMLIRSVLNYTLIQETVTAGNAVVALRWNPSNPVAHAVMIYAFENGNFKIKDSHGEEYQIPINDPEIYPIGYTFEFKCHMN